MCTGDMLTCSISRLHSRPWQRLVTASTCVPGSAGDAYMCTGNVRAPQHDHAARVARFAIDAVHAASEVAIREGDEAMGTVNIRAGEAFNPKITARRAGRECTAWGCPVCIPEMLLQRGQMSGLAQ